MSVWVFLLLNHSNPLGLAVFAYLLSAIFVALIFGEVISSWRARLRLREKIRELEARAGAKD